MPHQTALPGAHTAGVGVYHVRQKANLTAAMLHRRLQELYCEAKPGTPDIGDAHHMEPVCRARSVAKAYTGPDDRFAALSWNAAQDMFTFMRYPGMEPTNNRSERILRKVAIQDTPKDGNRRREGRVRHPDDMPAHVG